MGILKNLHKRTYKKDPVNRKNILFLRVYKLDDTSKRLVINDVQWNTYFVFEKNRMEAYVQRNHLGSNSTGVLVSGFTNTTAISSGRRRREATEEGWTDPVEYTKDLMNRLLGVGW